MGMLYKLYQLHRAESIQRRIFADMHNTKGVGSCGKHIPKEGIFLDISNSLEYD